MRSKAIQEIIEAVDGLDADDSAKTQFKKLVREISAAHGIRSISRGDRVDFARRLLNAKASVPTVRDRLMARFELSKRQAYRVIHEALQLCQNFAPNGTQEACNKGV